MTSIDPSLTTSEATPSSAPMTEVAAFADILEWSSTRPKWQQDALRRRISSGPLNATDIDELYKICIDASASYSPLTEAHISPDSVTGEPVSLLKISNPIGVNALANGEEMDFAPTGLTLVYGDNGSGKSGYVRILKDVCRSRDSRFSILSDINGTSDTPQSANIDYQCGSTKFDVKWSPEGFVDDHLPTVSIFDSRSANIHLKGQHNVAYTPLPLMVLKDIGEACDGLKTKIEADISSLKAQTPEVIKSSILNPLTPAGMFLFLLSAKTKPEELSQLITLSEEEIRRHETLKADLSGDPTKTIARLTTLRTRFLQQVDAVKSLIEATTESAFTTHTTLLTELNDKRSLAQAASEQLFKASPLPDISGNLWKSLWEAARAYSDNSAYPHKTYPEATLGEDLCVLCQQPLEAAAIDRRISFEAFIKGTTKSEEEAAHTAFHEARNELDDTSLSVMSITTLSKMVENELDEPELAQMLRACALLASRRLKALLSGYPTKYVEQSHPQAQIDTILTNLDERIAILGTDADSDERKELIFELEALNDRTMLKSMQADIIAEISRQVTIALLKTAIKDTVKTRITYKNKELSDKLVTQALCDRFKREIEKFGVFKMPVEIRKERDRNVESFFKIALVDKPTEPVGDILSEGEHRCVALAAFLAELVTSNEYSGIVFDDPMSSLDHLYRECVAKRLVEEAKHRQVVIFTHNLTFLFEVSKEAKEQSCTTKFQTIRRRGDVVGCIENDLPLGAKSAFPMENSIRSLLKANKGSFDAKPEAERSIMAKGIIAQIRIAWEQAIADFISPVLARFDSSVKPNSLYRLLVLVEEDIKTVNKARSRLSSDIHASPETLNPADIEHAQLVAELNVFRDWFTNLRARQKSAPELT